MREYHPLATTLPVFSLFSLNILGKLGFGALGGFEYVAILAGECRSPARTIGRSVMVAAPIIAIVLIKAFSFHVAVAITLGVLAVTPVPPLLPKSELKAGARSEYVLGLLTSQSLLAIVLDRLKGFQRGPFGCRENAIVVTKLEESIHWLRHRAEDREKRGVEGTLAK
jgi:hypothetical protein